MQIRDLENMMLRVKQMKHDYEDRDDDYVLTEQFFQRCALLNRVFRAMSWMVDIIKARGEVKLCEANLFDTYMLELNVIREEENDPARRKRRDDRESPNGLKVLYKISHADGRPVNPLADYFVLRLDQAGDPDHVKACRKALHTYMEEIRPSLPDLASDIKARYYAIGKTDL